MLNQFYNYLSDKIIKFLETESFKGGERYYLQFDEEKQVEDLYNVLRLSESAEEFSYTHKLGSTYSTFALLINDIRVVIAATINNVTPDFLVTLRNNVGEQKDEWKNTALLSICNETLDSIRGGSSDLQKEGMPLHVKTITKNLKKEIEKSNLSKSEQEVASFFLNEKLEDMVLQPNIFDFEEVLGLISQGSLQREDYKNLGLFFDENLDQYTPSQIRKRLAENHEFYEKIQHFHEYENLDQQLEKLFDEKGVTRLKKDDWKSESFQFIKKSNEIAVAPKKVLNYIEESQSKINKNLVYWDRPIQETKAGLRKRHIIIFNENKNDVINIDFEFDQKLKKEYIHKNNKEVCSVSGNLLKLELRHKIGQVTFEKVTYSHEHDSKSRYEFFIAIVECNQELLKGIQTFYEINVKDKQIVLNNKGETIRFGTQNDAASELVLEDDDLVVELDSIENGIEISSQSPAWDDGILTFKLSYQGAEIPFYAMDLSVKSAPVLGKRIWKLKREYQAHFNFVNNKLQQGTREYYPRELFKEFLEIEKLWINDQYKYARKSISGIEKLELDLTPNLDKAYFELIHYFKSNDLLPSLAYMDKQLLRLSKNYLEAFNEEIMSIKENYILNNSQLSLMKLGTIEESNQIYLTPLHPLNVAYQVVINEEINNEEVESHILDRLHPYNLLPFIYGEGNDIYRPVTNKDAWEWTTYQSLKKVTVGQSNEFLSKVIEEKISQFIEHFNYLFIEESQSPLKVNVIQITNDEEVLKGFINFIMKQVEKKGPHQVIPIEVALYHEEDYISSFEQFSLYDDINKIEEMLGFKLEVKNLDPVDLLRIIREKIHYYKLYSNVEYQFSHISFIKMDSNNDIAKDNMGDIETGISLNGLLSSITSMKGRKDYRTGFGTQNIADNINDLILTAKNLNELASNLEKGGANPYTKNKSIVTISSAINEENLNRLYESSYWVTFIDPTVGLEFFQRANNDLLVIHYSDQYNSSDQYVAITVTDKANQYRNVINQYLLEHNVHTNEENIDRAIKAFNTINGEWLLRVIGSKGHFSREKISIISALKYSLSFLDHPNITWLPISLEEVLRVSGAVKLNKSEGIFSAKNLGVRGSHSDDLLLVGMEVTDDEEIYMHYYPVEVKIGINQDYVISKAKEQIKKTKFLFNKELRKVNEDGNINFKNKFFRNFFIQLFLANVQKFQLNGIWPEKSFELVEKYKSKLLNDEYQIGYHLDKYLGKGLVLSFRKEVSWRSAKIDDEVLILELTEEDGYTGVIEDIEFLKDRIQLGNTDIQKPILLTSNYTKPENVEVLDILEILEKNPILDKQNVEGSNDNEETEHTQPKEIEKVEITDPQKQELKNVRVLLGNVEGSNKEIYWEYGHPKLANRHILISGKSGQGKSYFIQCMLLELSSQNISSIIFDYTDGFKKSKLEPEFKQAMGDKVEQILVAKDKFPINPFKRNKKELDEDEYIDEDFVDVAERMKNVLASIYKDLGIQQQNSIYQAIIRGMSEVGDNMNLEKLREELEKDSSGPAKTALSQLNPMIDKNPFNHLVEQDWSKLEKEPGKVFIIQLSGFTRDVQLMITEFILWDLWYYKLQHGKQSIPLPVILDEAQNLDHSEKSPSAKILTEGRKFGWSGWYATQFLKGQLTSDEISRLQNASHKIYFSPPDAEISSIASVLSHDANSRKEWEKTLATLQKGQCVSYGPMLVDDGSLKQFQPVVINIASLDKRM